MKKTTVFKIGFYCILGGLLAYIGFPYYTWECWAIILIVVAIDILSFISAND